MTTIIYIELINVKYLPYFVLHFTLTIVFYIHVCISHSLVSQFWRFVDDVRRANKVVTFNFMRFLESYNESCIIYT